MNRFYILFFLTCVLATGQSYSQESKFNISVHTNLNKSSSSTGNVIGTNSTMELKQFAITPRAVFRIDKVWAIGALYSYGNTVNRSHFIIPELVQAYLDTKTIDQHAGVLVQTYLFDNGKFAAFLELDGTKGSSKSEIVPKEDISILGTPTKSSLYSSAFHAGGRYTFFKGLGAEIRLNRLVSYRHLKTKDFDRKVNHFDLFNNFWNEVSLGLSYQF